MHLVNQLNNSALWAEPNPSKCPCRGAGWLLSDFDTWHQCCIHGGTPYPENDEACDAFDYEAHEIESLRRAFVVLRERSGMTGPAFREAVVSRAGRDATPRKYVEVAEGVAEAEAAEAAEAEARRLGYSCVVEMLLDDEARRGDFR